MKSGTEEANTISKREGNDGHEATQCTKPGLGAKTKLNEKPTRKNKQDMGPHQYPTRLFNAEVNLASDWMIEQKPQLVKHKR
jgi:hypothetical protein